MSYRIGIPRALMYHYYFPAWNSFFQELGCEVVLSPKTNKGILDEGVKRAVDDLCLPFKVYYGHVYSLLDKVDYLFVPRMISLGDNNYLCPKFMGLPDMLKATFKKLPPLLEPVVDLRKGLWPYHRLAHQIGKKLGAGFIKIEKAIYRGKKEYRRFVSLQQQGYTPLESMEILNKQKKVVKKAPKKK